MTGDTGRVVVVGAGIAGLTAAHRLAGAGIEVTVLEAERRPGGRMSTLDLDAGPMECGAQFLSTGYAVIPELLAASGLAGQVVPVSGRTAILTGGRLRGFATDRPASLLSGGVLRARDIPPAVRGAMRTRRLADRRLEDLGHWADLDGLDGHAWAVAHFGRGLTDRLLAPTVLGLYFLDLAGTGAALAAALTGFTARRARAMTVRGGLGRLTSALASGLDVEYGVRVERVARDDGAGAVLDTSRGRLRVPAVVLATPARPTAAILAGPTPRERSVLAVPYSPGLLVGLALREPLSPEELGGAYGILADPREASALASVAVSSRADSSTSGGDVLTVMLRPSAARALRAAADPMVRAAAVDALAPLLPGLAGRVTDARVVRWDQAMPSVPVGHTRAVTAYRAGVSPADAVLLAGDYLGFPWTDSAAFNGRWAADRLLAHGAPRGQTTRHPI
ncbi:NAD(P)/FAD-dependent oxidoreductase [Nonomuraea sp. MTCD27]|uniref:protoporphyrinogen/coproporphyrinogen oxidase n=1 Tax=Nonomuraea sp. MTCD27 TaxID=1676747 RepID=UPI0035C212BA